MKEYAIYVGVVAGVCTAISMIPQLVKIIKTKKADDISYSMLFVLFAGISAWIWYGFLKKDFPIIITNFVSLVVNILIITFSIRYKK